MSINSTKRMVLCNIFSFHRVYFRIFFQDIKLQKNFSFSSSRNPSWNSDTESSHRPTQTTLVRDALMQCRGKKKKRIGRKIATYPYLGWWEWERMCRAAVLYSRAKNLQKNNKSVGFPSSIFSPNRDDF